MDVLAVEGLTFAYPVPEDARGRGNLIKPAVKDITFSIKKGEFIAVCGATGSGKSTLLRLLKPELTPPGELSGEAFFLGKPLVPPGNRETAAKIGFVMQKPEQQIVTDKVWHELAFGLENLGLPQGAIRRRVAEMSGYFGIEEWFEKGVSELSGGQKQLLNLASVMVMQPEVLILDEPTAQLDPIAASDFIATLVKLCRELSLTIIIAEHRLEEIIPVCDRLMALERGGMIYFGGPRLSARSLADAPALLGGMPAAVRLYCRLGAEENKANKKEMPLSVREGRRFVEENYKNEVRSLPDEVSSDKSIKKGPPALEFSEVYYKYSRTLPDVLRGLSFKVEEGELFFLLGGNGSGKTTALGAAAGLNKIYSGKIKVFGKNINDYKNRSLYRECLALLPQDVQTLFLENSVRAELASAYGKIEDVLKALPYDIEPLFDKHPYDLSGGEQQLVALARVLAAKPKLLLLDEPTKGLDASAKEKIAGVLRSLKASGTAVVIVTHDVEFAAGCADRCALFFRGEIISEDTPRAFFSGNSFYTTAANRMTRGLYDNAVTVDDICRLCMLNGRVTEVRRYGGTVAF